MRIARSLALVALVGPLLGAQQAQQAQQAQRSDAPAAGRLAAELHFITSGDAWFSTNRSAYVAVFEVSRSRVTQLYPTFSAQASIQTGADRKIELTYSPPLPSINQSSLVSLDAAPPPSQNAWPRILVLVASTSPLRVGNWWTSSYTINQDLFGQRHWTDLQTEGGIDALVQLVRPLDPSADVATDRVDGIVQPVFATTMASYDPNTVALYYSCIDAARTFASPVPLPGATCYGVRNLPPSFNGANGAAVVAADANTPAANPGRPAVAQSRNISDPAEIRRFIDEQARQSGRIAEHQATGTGGSPVRSAAVDGRPADRSATSARWNAGPEQTARGNSNDWKRPPAPTNGPSAVPGNAPSSSPTKPAPTVVAPPASAPTIAPVKPPTD